MLGVRIFFYIFGCAAVACAFSLILQYALGPEPVFEVAASGVFFLALTACIYIDKVNLLAEQKRLIFAPFAFVAASTGLAVLGMFVLSWSPTLGVVLISPMGLGYYPSGADVPFVYGAAIWAISMMALGGGAVATAVFLRYLYHRRHREF